MDKFDSVQTEIELIKEEGDPESNRIEFENAYYTIVSKAKNKLANVSAIASVNLNQASNLDSHNCNNVKLPILNLPKFEGDYQTWNNFKQTFTALIIESSRFSQIEKFHYLQSCLKGKAAETIASLQITNENFTIAWELLNQRFENKKLIVFSHIASLVDIPNIAKENHVMLRNLLDSYLKNSRALEALGENVQSWGSLLIYILINKLDFNSRKLWEQETNDTAVALLTKLENFLKTRCQLLESIA